MKVKKRFSLKNPEVIFLTFFGAGLAKKAPGTVGTIACLPFYYFLSQIGCPYFLFLPFLITMTIASCFIADYAQRKYEAHDPGWIVMDEVLGMGVTWCFIQSPEPLHLLIAFGLFRFFDIIKFWPASYLDKEVKHGTGTIMDDIVSGIYAGLVYLLINYTAL